MKYEVLTLVSENGVIISVSLKDLKGKQLNTHSLLVKPDRLYYINKTKLTSVRLVTHVTRHLALYPRQ